MLESGSLSNLVCEQVEREPETRSPIRAVTAQGIEMFLVLDASKSNIGPCVLLQIISPSADLVSLVFALTGDLLPSGK